MKKIVSLLSVFALTLCFLAGCSAAPSSPFTRSGFLDNTALKGVVNVVEHNEYTVTYDKNADSKLGVDYVIDSNASYLKTDLRTENLSGSDRYVFSTDLKIVGTYTINGVSTAVSSIVTSSVVFSGLVDGFKPLSSSREVDSTVLEAEGDSYKFVRYKYSVSSKYEENSVVVTVTPEKIGDETYPAEGENTYNKIFASTYIDNEQLLFAPRAMTLSSSTSVAFKSVDALKKSVVDLKLVYANSDPVQFAVGQSIRKVGAVEEKRTKVSAVALSLSLNSTYSGATQTLYYAADSEQNEYSRLIKMVYPATYSTGNFVFLINSSEIAF